MAHACHANSVMTTGIGPSGTSGGNLWRGHDRNQAIFNAVNRLSGTVDEAIFPKARSYTRATSLRTWTSEGPL
jgi:hypothetical protein